MKRCHLCLITKPLDCFPSNRSRGDGVGHACSRCSKERALNWYHDNKERAVDSYRLRRYGITRDQFNQLLAIQDSKCAICGKKGSGRNGTTELLFIDHCHQAKRFRGLLCHSCNIGLGNFGDDVDRLRNAIKYLENPPSNEILGC